MACNRRRADSISGVIDTAPLLQSRGCAVLAPAPESFEHFPNQKGFVGAASECQGAVYGFGDMSEVLHKPELSLLAPLISYLACTNRGRRPLTLQPGGEPLLKTPATPGPLHGLMNHASKLRIGLHWLEGCQKLATVCSIIPDCLGSPTDWLSAKRIKKQLY